MKIMTCFAMVLSSVCCLAQTARVIVIGVDGLSVDGIATAPTPRLHELMSRGAWTLEARGVMPTLSSPNWESAIGGASPEQHGITSNGHFRRMAAFPPVCYDSERKFPTIFGVLRDQQPGSRIAVFHDWRGFAKLIERRAADVMEHEPGALATTNAAIEYWKRNHPALMFIHIDNVDHAGHAVGWRGKEYYRAVSVADDHIGRVVDMLDEEAAWGSTFLMITSDHGGTDRGHGRNSLAEIQIPWILVGPGVVHGRIRVPVNTYDTAATLAWIFRLATPRCWTGRPVAAAFGPARVSELAGLSSPNACTAPPLPSAAPQAPRIASRRNPVRILGQPISEKPSGVEPF